MILPPYARFLGIEIVAAQASLLRLPFSDRLLGRPGYLHGGVIGGLLEMAAVVALADACRDGGDGDGDDGNRGKPINSSIDFMRGGRAVDTFARGIVTRLGSRVADVTATAWQDDPDRPIAGARMHYLLRA